MKKIFFWLAIAVASVGGFGGVTALAQGAFPVMELSAGFYRISAEVAATPASRAQGLMHRQSMPDANGMLFVFKESDTHCMWMRNTLLPLSVAFLDEGGRIINIADMKPLTEDNHCASRPARFALEMNAGWFQKRGVGVGAVIKGTDRAPAPR